MDQEEDRGNGWRQTTRSARYSFALTATVLYVGAAGAAVIIQPSHHEAVDARSSIRKRTPAQTELLVQGTERRVNELSRK